MSAKIRSDVGAMQRPHGNDAKGGNPTKQISELLASKGTARLPRDAQVCTTDANGAHSIVRSSTKGSYCSSVRDEGYAIEEDDPSPAESTIGADYQLPTIYQPNRANQFLQLFVSNFITCFSSTDTDTSGLHMWAAELPRMLTISKDQPVAYAIRATSMYMYGSMSGGKAIQIEACKSYFKGLQEQRSCLNKVSETSNNLTFNEKTVCASIMFSLFESMICTTPFGWLHHLVAAENMLEARGPQYCTSGLMHMLFKTAKLFSVSIAMTLERPCAFSSEDWCTVPFTLHAKTPFDELVDILVQLPACLPLRNDMRRLREQDPLSSELFRCELSFRAEQLLSRLDHFWTKYKYQIDPDYQRRWSFYSSIHQVALEVMHQGPIPLSGKFTVNNTFTATFVSLYDAANIIVLRYLAACSMKPGGHDHRMTAHAASVLASAAYHEAAGPFSGGSFSMVFPLKIVCLLAPSGRQRNAAQESLLLWGRDRGMDDICQAAPMYMEGGHG